MLQLGIHLLLMAQNMIWIWSLELCYYLMIVYHYILITPNAMIHLPRTKILREIEQIENCQQLNELLDCGGLGQVVLFEGWMLGFDPQEESAVTAVDPQVRSFDSNPPILVCSEGTFSSRIFLTCCSK